MDNVTLTIEGTVLDAQLEQAVRQAIVGLFAKSSSGPSWSGKGYLAIVKQAEDWAATRDFVPEIERYAAGVIEAAVKAAISAAVKARVGNVIAAMIATSEFDALIAAQVDAIIAARARARGGQENE